MVSVGVDIGGTFTDFVLLDRRCGSLRTHKCLTTVKDPSVGVLTGLRVLLESASLSLGDVGEIIHGTTLVTNAIIERKGARLGLITTRGFRDVLEFGTEQRYDIYDLFLRFPAALVPRRLRLEVTERMDAQGRIVIPLAEREVEAAARQLVVDGAEAVAIVFLHAYANPEHEQRAAAAFRRIAPGLSVVLSSEVAPEIGEYPRAVTACANAYVQPAIERYLFRLESALRAEGFAGRLHLVHSAGGLISPATARRCPVRLLESGPAGGALATAFLAARAGLDDAIAFDMGGTTAKTCLIRGGRAETVAALEAARVHRFKRGSGLPIRSPVIDLIEIGAGGGSIAHIDPMGLLRVGPESAGADPGPACYGLGGTAPTVTDAALLLGWYDDGNFLGGRMRLDRRRAEAAIGDLAIRLGLGVPETAWGIVRVVTEAMAQAVRVHSVEKGCDPRRFTLVGFGGAGPAFAARVARLLGIAEVIVPPACGAASALGFLLAPMSFETVQSFPVVVGDDLDTEAINAVLTELAEMARARVAEAVDDPHAITIERAADMRLVGQLHDVTVPLPDGPITAGSVSDIVTAFRRAYEARHTTLWEGAPIEILSLRVRARGPKPELPLTLRPTAAPAPPEPKGRRRLFFDGRWVEGEVWDRATLRSGDWIPGPAVVEENEATVLVPPGDGLTVDAVGNLRLSVKSVAHPTPAAAPSTSFAEAVRSLQKDPVTLEILWARLVSITEEMWETVRRAAFSLIISEAQDFACEILDHRGETLAHSPRAMPVFNLTVQRAARKLLEAFPASTLRPGDVLVTNDPWACAGHLFDLALLAPVFVDGRMVGFVASVGHVSDIGGTKDGLRAREVFEEGLQIPPLKLFREGVENDDLMRLIASNVRNPIQVLGDIHALVAALRLGADRLRALMAEYGLGDLAPLAAVVQDRAEAAMRAAIRALPSGTWRAGARCNPLGEPFDLPLALTVAGDEIVLDFTGAPEQFALGGVNCTLNYTEAHATYPLKCILSPTIRGNAGCFRPFRVIAPDGSVLNARRPAAVGQRTRTGWSIAPAIFAALAFAAPDRVQARTGLPSAISIYGRDGRGRFFSDHLFMGGGQGASAHGDGKSGLLWPTSAANTSVERLESRVPVIVEEKVLVPDSGGPGRHRGGLGQRVRLRKRDDDGQPLLVSLYPEGVGIATEGLFGGQGGAPASGRVCDRDGRVLRDCGAGELVTLTRVDELVELRLAGGAGYGEPKTRPLALVAADLAEGYVTAGGAARDYRVVVRADGSIDEEATCRARGVAAAQ